MKYLQSSYITEQTHYIRTQRVAMKKENTYLPSARKIFQRYERVSHTENILLVGTVGAGKSATINTITAALSGRRNTVPPSALSSPQQTGRGRGPRHTLCGESLLYTGCTGCVGSYNFVRANFRG